MRQSPWGGLPVVGHPFPDRPLFPNEYWEADRLTWDRSRWGICAVAPDPIPSAGVAQGRPAQRGRERMVLLMVNEAARVLSEGVVADAGTLDLAMILGTGWAPHRGGPLTYAASRGSGPVLHALEMMLLRHGERFQPAPHLKQLLQGAGIRLDLPVMRGKWKRHPTLFGSTCGGP